MQFLILGPLEVRGEQGAVALGGNKLRGLLAVLLLHANRPVSTDRLAVALWGQDASNGVTKTVQVTVSRLRKALGDRVVIATTPAGYCLQMQPDELDATRFERLAEDGSRALDGGRPEHAGAFLREALSLWRGPALADLAFQPFAAAEITRLEEQRLAALETRIEADLAAGRHAELVAELRCLVAVNPTRERLAAQLMLALYRCGRQTDALEAYQDTRSALIADVGIEPGPGLRELQEAVLRQDTALEPDHRLPDLSSARETTTAWPAVAHDDEPVVLALPRALQVPAGAAFVGRDAELARLRGHWPQIGGGARSAVMISGEPGIGKTRLASEFGGMLHREGELVLYGRCDEGLAVPYQPLVEALRPYARALGFDRLRAQLGHLAPELGRMWPELAGLGEPMRADPQSERFALFEALAALIEAMTRERQALLILDDLHWASRPTLLLLRHLIRSERQLGVLVLGTYRETELDAGQPLAQLLGDLQRDASAQHMRIGGLDEAAIALLFEAAVGHALDERAPQLLRALRTQTAGNPFFIREMLAHMVQSSTNSSQDEGSSGVAATQLRASEGLRHVIGQRVARLSAPTGCMLRVAAVAGPTFSFVLLERAHGEWSDVLDALDEAVGAGLLSEAGDGEYAFAHALVHETIYQQLGSARRMRLHRQLGEALETLGRQEAHVEALAYHFAQAAADGQSDKAADYALAAGRNAIGRLGYEDAAAHYERGLEALTLTGRPHEQRRYELLLALGQAHWGAGELDNARQACWQAAELAESLGNDDGLARAALGFCGPHRAEMTAAVTAPVADLLQRALDALGDQDSSLRAQLMGRLGAVPAYTGAEPGTPALARQALEMARRVPSNATLADVLASAHVATHGPDTLDESIALAEELGRVADEIGNRRLRARAHGWLLDHLLERGDIDGVGREYQALQRLAETRDETYLKWFLAMHRVGPALLEGRLEDCDTLAHEALIHRFRGHDETAAYTFGVQMLFVRREQGRLDELLEGTERLVAQSPQLTSWRCALACVYAQLQRTAQARHELEALAHADFSDLPRDTFWLSNLSALCAVVTFLGDVPRAQRLYELLLPYADRCAVPGHLLCHGSASRPLGLLATTLSRYTDAERHFEHALKMNTQIRSPLWIAHTQHDYAHMLLLRSHPDDNDKTLELLTAALATAEQLGLKALADKTRPLKLTAEAPGYRLLAPRTAQRPFQRTAR